MIASNQWDLCRVPAVLGICAPGHLCSAVLHWRECMRLELEVQSIPSLTSGTANQNSIQFPTDFPYTDVGKTSNQLLQHPLPERFGLANSRKTFTATSI